MFCTDCGAKNHDGDRFCHQCGNELDYDDLGLGAGYADKLSDNEASSRLNDRGTSSRFDTEIVRPMSDFDDYVSREERAAHAQSNRATNSPSGLNTASLVLGILSVVACYFSFVLGILAIVFGAVGSSKPSNNKAQGKAGLILGIIAMSVWFVVIASGTLASFWYTL